MQPIWMLLMKSHQWSWIKPKSTQTTISLSLGKHAVDNVYMVI